MNYLMINDFDEEKTVCADCAESANEGITDDRERYRVEGAGEGPCEVCG